jgi:AraC-like DNA-binding protein
MDLRPGYRERRFGAGLECAWVRVGASTATTTRVLPDACVDLVWRAGEGAVLAGPDTGPVLVPTEPGSVIVGIRCGPGTGAGALGLGLEAVRDARVPLAALRPDLDRALPGDLEPREALDRLIRAGLRLFAGGEPDRAVREAARRLTDPRTRVDALAAELGLSERQLRRRCRTAAGYGPKTLQRVLRFQRFLEIAEGGGELAMHAAEAGYADQAHMTREVRRLAGVAPLALLRERAQAGMGEASPMRSDERPADHAPTSARAQRASASTSARAPHRMSAASAGC